MISHVFLFVANSVFPIPFLLYLYISLFFFEVGASITFLLFFFYFFLGVMGKAQAGFKVRGTLNLYRPGSIAADL